MAENVLSDYDKQGLDRDAQIVMATLRRVGFRGTEQMKAFSLDTAQKFRTFEQFESITASLADPGTPGN